MENIHMLSDFTVQKDALSCGKAIFSLRMKKKKINFKNPRPPLWTFFFGFFIFFLETLTYSSNYQTIKFMGPHLHIFLKNHNKIKFIGFFTKNQKSYIYPEECTSNDVEMIQKVKKLCKKSVLRLIKIVNLKDDGNPVFRVAQGCHRPSNLQI